MFFLLYWKNNRISITPLKYVAYLRIMDRIVLYATVFILLKCKRRRQICRFNWLKLKKSIFFPNLRILKNAKS